MRTNPLCYLVAFLLVLGGWIAAAAIGATSWDGLHTANVTQIQNGAKIRVTDRGVAFFTDLVQQRDVTCRSTPVGSLDIQGTKFDITNNDGVHKWHLLSRTIDAKAGTYAVSCLPSDKAIDTADYGYAELPSFHRAAVGKGVGSIATLLAAGLAAWCYWGRRTERVLSSIEST